MRRRALPSLLLVVGLAAAAGCGKKGPIQAPLVRTPQAVEGFKAFQRGGAFRLEWTLPPAYIDGTPFTKPVEVEIWLVEEEIAPPPAAPAPPAKEEPLEKEQKAEEKPPTKPKPTEPKTVETKPAETKPAEPQPVPDKPAAPQAAVQAAPSAEKPPQPAPSAVVSGEMPLEMFKDKAVLAASLPADFGGAATETGTKAPLDQSYERPFDPARLNVRATFAVRVKDDRGKYSEYSSRITLVPRILPGPPRAVRLTLFEDKIVLSWEPPAAGPDPAATPVPSGYNVYRSQGAEPPRLLNENGPEKDPRFEDKAFAFGETYRYTVRAVLGDAPPYLESADAEAAAASPKDTFPPAPPAGLKTVAGPGFISLSWEDGLEADLAGFRVWRKAPDEDDFRPLTDAPVRETNYVDRAVRSGARYAYALSALDKAGNESRRTKAVSETARSPRP